MPYYSTEIERLGENCEKTGKLDGEVKAYSYQGILRSEGRYRTREKIIRVELQFRFYTDF